jgi:L-histidine N-alpha-methyltransferase
LAYNDAAEVTAAFNLNVLRVLNRELDADFDLDAFEHSAHYDDVHDRMEIHLVARSPQRIEIPGAGVVTLETAETIRTELSHKYDRQRVAALFAAADLEVARWAEDDDGYFALVLGRPTSGSSARSSPRSIAGDTP